MVFLGEFDSDVGFNMRERRYTTLDQLQIDALEVEENLASTRKSRAKKEPAKPKRGKEEASSFGRVGESSNPRCDDLDKLIKSIKGLEA